jgi:hypothetical protein
MDDHVSTIARILTITSSIRPRVAISVGTCIEAFEVIMDAMTEMIEVLPETHQAQPSKEASSPPPHHTTHQGR